MIRTRPRPRLFSSSIRDNAACFDDQMPIAPAPGADEGEAMSAYTSFLRQRARAHLPATHADTEVWVALRGAIGVGPVGDTMTV